MLTYRPRPTLTLIGMEDCDACKQVKQELAQLKPKFDRAGIQLAWVDITTQQISIPIKATPAFHLQLDGAAFFVDAQDFGEQAGRPPDAATIEEWVAAAIKKVLRR